MRTVNSPQCENQDCHTAKNHPIFMFVLAHFNYFFYLIHLCLRQCNNVYLSSAVHLQKKTNCKQLAAVSTVLCQSLRRAFKNDDKQIASTFAKPLVLICNGKNKPGVCFRIFTNIFTHVLVQMFSEINIKPQLINHFLTRFFTLLHSTV